MARMPGDVQDAPMPLKTKTYRIPEELLERIEAYRAQLEASLHLGISESQAVVSLISKGLEADGAAPAPARKRGT